MNNGIENYIYEGNMDSDKLWKPLRMDFSLLDVSLEEKKTLFLCKTFNSILNKLTRKNFVTSMNKMKNLPINTPDRMQKVVDIIHAKALKEWKFRNLYAKACNFLKDTRIVDDKRMTFSSYLITRCRKYFDAGLMANLVYERKKFEIDLIDCKTTKKNLLDECLIQEDRDNKQFIENCRFICELFKSDAIHLTTLLEILNKLFKSNGNTALQSVHIVLSTVIEFSLKDEFIIEKIPPIIFKEIKSLLQREKLPLRIRLISHQMLNLRKSSSQPIVPSEFFENCMEHEISVDILPESNLTPLALLTRENFEVVVEELRRLPKIDEPKQEATTERIHDKSNSKKYSVDYLKNFRDLPHCQKSIEINPYLKDKLYCEDVNDAKAELQKEDSDEWGTFPRNREWNRRSNGRNNFESREKGWNRTTNSDVQNFSRFKNTNNRMQHNPRFKPRKLDSIKLDSDDWTLVSSSANPIYDEW